MADARPDEGSIVVTDWPPKFLAKTLSGRGVNLKIKLIMKKAIDDI